MIYSKVLAAVDDRPNSNQTVKTAIQFARQLHAAIGLVYVLDRNKEIVSGDIAVTPEQSSTLLLKKGQRVLDLMKSLYVKDEKVFQFMPEGFPKNEIIRIAKEWEANLIVMGSNETRDLFHVKISPVTEYVIRHSKIPVMIVPLNSPF